MKRLNRRCPICGCDMGEVLHTIDMRLPQNVKLADSYDVVTCKQCGFAYADTISTQADFNHYYKECNVYSSNGEVKKEFETNMYDIPCRLFRKYIGREKRILDIGCGDGSFLLHLRRNGYNNIFGMDPSEKSIMRLKENSVEGVVGNVFDTAHPNMQKSFDVVMCTAVIEHLLALDVFVSHLQEYLVDDSGIIFISAPAVEGFEGFVTSVPNYFNHEHINYFSLVSLDNLMRKNSFSRISTDEESYCLCGFKEQELALQGVYSYHSNCKREMIRDIHSRESITKYFSAVKAVEESKNIQMRQLLKTNDKVIIWGIGSYAMQLLDKYPDLQKAVQFFIDNNETKLNMKLCDRCVYSAMYLLEEPSEYPILICSMLNADDIIKQIEDMNIMNPYVVV